MKQTDYYYYYACDMYEKNNVAPINVLSCGSHWNTIYICNHNVQ